MSQPNPSTAMARAIVDQLWRGGVSRVIVSPGSRSAALTIAAAEHPHISTAVVLDERSAGFRALGAAKADGSPAAVICTSGTAPANYLPAVVEADMSMTPLIVLSADRPEELRGVGANQTIDQVALYGGRVRFFADIPAPSVDEDSSFEWRRAAQRAVAAAVGSEAGPGPVHLNVAFREPTVPVSNDGRTTSSPYPFSIDDLPEANEARVAASRVDVDLPASGRGMVIAGDGDYSRSDLAVAASRLGWPVLATAQSGLRDHSVVTAYHHVLAGGVPEDLRPEVVVAVGAIGPSQRLEDLVAAAATRVRVDTWGRTIDPGRNATSVLASDPVQLLESVELAGKSDFAEEWAEVDTAVRSVAESHLLEADENTGPGVVLQINEVDWPALVAGSSLPIRDVDAHLSRGGGVIANRGASGIDGFNSTALGVSDVIPGTVALTGDLGFLHDSNAFIGDTPTGCVFVVVDNNGGGLFDALPPARHAPDYERLFVTPHHRRLQLLAEFHGLDYRLVDVPDELASAVAESIGSPTTVIHVPVDRANDLETRRQLDERSRQCVASR